MPIRILCLLIGWACYAAHADTRKLDAQIGAQLHHYNTYKTSPLARSAESSGDVSVVVTVHFSGDALEQIKARGAQIRSVFGDVATINVPMSQLSAIAALPNVHRIEAPRRPVARLDKSVPYTKADTLRTGSLSQGWTGLTGKNVLIGVIDTGLDLSHRDFMDAQGNTRVVRLWNQRQVTGGTPPKGADGTALYGAECDAAAINTALKSSTDNVCNPTDTGMHGTHVGGIAAGNGGATGNGQTVGRFVGMAPEAGLLVANAIDSQANSTNGDPFLDAIAWMTRVARELNRPLVINMSLGSYFSNRDGTGSTERVIDNISAPGVIVVAAAGNEGDVPIRTELTPMTVGQTIAVTFQVPSGRTAEKLEFWSNGDNRYAIQLVCPNSAATTSWTTASTSNAASVLDNFDRAGCGKVEVSSTPPSPTNGDRQYVINLSNGSSNALTSGDWVLNIRADAIAVASEKLGIISGEDAKGATFTGNFKVLKTSGIITDTGSARRAITVAAVNTRYSWTNAQGAYELSPGNGELGDVSTFSSNGPRRVCSANSNYIDTSTSSGVSNAYECKNPVMKPDLAAPGSYIMSALSKSAAKTPNASDVEADGVHVALMGTSMAAPHVTGAVALMLQADPQLTPELAKQYLARTVQSNSYTQAAQLPTFSSGVAMPPSPNFSWGYGPVDVAATTVLVKTNASSGSTVTTTTTTTTSTTTTSTTSRGTTTTQVAATTTTTLAALTVQLVKGWNLIGNGMSQTFDVTTAFGDSKLFTTVWKWVASKSAWAFYAPSMNTSTLATYAQAKGYEVLTTLNPGDGFWVNAAQPVNLSMPSATHLSSERFGPTGSAALSKGWSLIAVGDSPLPNDFNQALGGTPPSTGGVPINLTTLWAWDSAASNWMFYAPSLLNAGTLESYISSKGYVPFGSKTLTPAMGFWVNKP